MAKTTRSKAFRKDKDSQQMEDRDRDLTRSFRKLTVCPDCGAVLKKGHYCWSQDWDQDETQDEEVA